MTPTSTLGSLKFVVDVPTEKDARQVWPVSERVHEQVILPVLRRVLDEMAPEGLHTMVQGLSIDLGTTTAEGFERAVGERFEEALRKALGEALRAAREKPSEEAMSVPESARRLDLFEHYLSRGTLPTWAPGASVFSFDELVRELVERSPEELVSRLRQAGRDRGALQRLAWQLGDEVLARLLRALDAEGASLILQYLSDLREVHRAEPVPPVGDDAFRRLLWVLVLDFELHDPGSQFNRRTFVRSVLQGIAESESLRYADVLAALSRGLGVTERVRPLGSSLPAVIRELSAELMAEDAESDSLGADGESDSLGADGESDSLGAGGETDSFGANGESDSFGADGESDSLGGAGESDSLAGGGDGESWGERAGDGPAEVASALVALERMLEGSGDGGAAGARGAMSLEALVLQVCRTAPAELARRIRERAHDIRVLERIATSLGEEALRRLLRVLDPESAALIVAYLTDLRDVHRARPMPKLEDDAFGRLLWRLVLGFVARDAGSQFNRRTFVRTLLHGAAEAEAISYADLVTALSEGLRETEKKRPLASSLPAVLREILLEVEVVSDRKGASPRPRDEGLPSFEEALMGEALSMLEGPDADLPAFAAKHLSNRRTREQWASRLPPALLVRLCAARAPQSHRSLLAAAEIMAGAWQAASPPEPRPAADRSVFWSIVLEVFAAEGAPSLSLEKLTASLLDRFIARSTGVSEDPGTRQTLALGITGRAARMARDAGNAGLGAALERRAAEILASRTRGGQASPQGASSNGGNSKNASLPNASSPNANPQTANPQTANPQNGNSRTANPQNGNSRTASPGPAPKAAPTPDRSRDARPAKPASASVKRPPLRGRTAFGLDNDSTADREGTTLFVQNAGLVLVAVFLPQFFRALDFLAPDAEGALRMRDEETLSRAVHLLQHVAFGTSEAPEPVLVLNKLLCGAPPSAPVAPGVALTEQELRASDMLLRSVLAGWTILTNTSVAGLRETFLQREGKLVHGEDRWNLKVQRTTVDVLVDQIPWSLSVVAHPWMPTPIYVTW